MQPNLQNKQVFVLFVRRVPKKNADNCVKNRDLTEELFLDGA